MLAPMSFTLEPTALGSHTDIGGILYTGKAGFVDLGHVRDIADLTGFVYQQIHGASGARGTSITTIEGTAQLTRALAQSEWLEVARSIAFDDALAHEISSWSNGRCGDIIPRPGGHNSSFSPEDLPSNFLGTLVADRALRAGGTFATEVERQISILLTSLDVQSKAETQRAFDIINGDWVDRSLTVVSNCFLRRRNFSATPKKAGHPRDAATPAFVTAPFSVSSPLPYTYQNASGFTRADFPAKIAAIQSEAQTLYGPRFAL